MLSRREFLRYSSVCLAAIGIGTLPLTALAEPLARPFTLTEIAGKPRERGREYGRRFKDSIAAFLDKEIYARFIAKPAPKDEMLRYAGACAKAVREYSPVIHEELEGMAETSGLRLEELVLITLHEELYHRGTLPKIPHCTAVAVGPPDTADGRTYVGQTWDWMESVAGMSSMLHWKRPEGPSLLAYAFPGLWVGAGLNSAGLALTWTSANLGAKEPGGARVGISSYLLLTHLLYQDSIEAVITEAKRCTNAGWFTFVMADGKGNLANIEGSPAGIVTETHRGRLARVGFGSREMTKTADGAKVKQHPRCQKMYDLAESAAGKLDAAGLQEIFANPKHGICVGKSTIDMMVYDTTKREAYLSRGPEYGVNWRKFGFEA